MSNVKDHMEAAVVGAAKQVEKHLDEEIERLSTLKDDDLETIRQRRMQQMKKEAEDRALWQRNGHGTVHHVVEKDFFSRAKTAPRVVAVFFRQGTSRYSSDFNEHIARVAQAHLETLFLTLDAEKCPFLCTRLSLRVLPSIVMLKDGEIDIVLRGLDGITPSGKFSTTSIEKRLFEYGMLTNTNISDDS